MQRKIIERVANENDRREFALQLTPKGRALYEELIPRLLRKEQQILSCLSAQERKNFAAALGKIEHGLGLAQTIKEPERPAAIEDAKHRTLLLLHRGHDDLHDMRRLQFDADAGPHRRIGPGRPIRPRRGSSRSSAPCH